MFKNILIFTFFFFSILGNSHAINPTPAQIDQAIEDLGEWHFRTTNHQKFMSATPLGRLRSVAEFLSHDEADFGWDFGYSIMNVPMGEELKTNYEILGFDRTSIPDEVNLTRFHFSQAFAQSFDVGLSALVVPDINYYGAGANLSLNLINLTYLYTSVSVKYSQSRTDAFTSNSLGVGVSQSINLNWLDLYAGANFLTGSTSYKSTGASNELPIDDVKISGLETYFGGVLALTGNLRGTVQYNNTNYEQTFSMKISFKIASFMPLIPLWMTEDHY